MNQTENNPVSYLDNLHFDQKLGNSWQAKYIKNIRVVIMLILSIIVLGIYSFLILPRRLNPEVKIPIILVTTVLPGASPDEIESLVTIPLEDKLNSLKGLDSITSSSAENFSSLQLRFQSNIDVDQALTDTQNLVNQVTNLPTDAKTPQVASIDFENQPIWTFIITTSKDYASLARFSQGLKDKIEEASLVDSVSLSGLDTQEIQVVIDNEKLRTYGLTPITLSQLVAKATNSYPAGNINTSSSSFAIAINKEVNSVDDIRNLTLTTATGEVVKLGDVAKIVLQSKVEQSKTFFATSQIPKQNAIQLSVFKIRSANIDTSEKQVAAIIDQYFDQYKNDFQLVTVANYAEEITSQFNDLFKEFVSTIILVFILLLIFLGLRQAIIASLTIPLTFLSTFAIINALGLSLNFLTMFALLIALGLLIDDTIVVVAAMTRYYKTGKFTPWETGVLVWKDFILPLWSTTITTIWAFVPLLIASGIIGEFIKVVPIVVTATLLSSTTIAVIITIPLMVVFLKPALPNRVNMLFKILAIIFVLALVVWLLPKTLLLPIILLVAVGMAGFIYKFQNRIGTRIASGTQQNPQLQKVKQTTSKIIDHGLVNIEALSVRYMKVIRRVLDSAAGRRNALIAVVSFAVVAYLLLPAGLVSNIFFPKTNEDLVYIEVEMPVGSNLNTSISEQKLLLESLRKTPDTSFVLTNNGPAGVSQRGGSAGGQSSNIFSYTLHLVPESDRKLTSQEIAQQLREKYASYSVGKLSVVEVSSGPPTGSDIQIKLLGQDLSVVDTYANRVVSFLEKEPGVTNIAKSAKPGTSKLVFVPDKTKLAENGITVDAIALWLRTYASGFALDTLKVDNEETDIVFRTQAQINSPETLGSISIPSLGRSGNPAAVNQVPLLSLGRFELQNNPTLITREDGKRSITISASTIKGVNSNEKNSKLQKFVSNLNLPSGYEWKTGGANEEDRKSVQSILQAMLISFILILITMVIEFGSFRQTIIALLLIPISISGVFYMFALAGIPLSFPALIGILALFGIVVTHAIVVIEKINENLKEKLPLKEAIVDAAGNRLEPVLLTSLATIVGLIPITIADPLWRGLGGAIIAGLLFSGVIKLFFVPVLYYEWYKPRQQKTKKEN